MNRRTAYMILDLKDSTQEVYAQLKDTFLVCPETDYYNWLLDDFKSVYLKKQADKAPEVGLFYSIKFILLLQKRRVLLIIQRLV